MKEFMAIKFMISCNIKFTNGMFGLFFQSDEGEFFIEMDSESMEIIGNIHENPELLK